VNFDSNHPLIAGAIGAFLRLVFVRPMNALEAVCNLTVGAIVAWYGAPVFLRLFPETIQAEPRAAGLAGLILGFVSMWVLSWVAESLKRSRGNPFDAYRNIRKAAEEDQPKKSRK
jgi:hypothetical protein